MEKRGERERERGWEGRRGGWVVALVVAAAASRGEGRGLHGEARLGVRLEEAGGSHLE